MNDITIGPSDLQQVPVHLVTEQAPKEVHMGKIVEGNIVERGGLWRKQCAIVILAVLVMGKHNMLLHQTTHLSQMESMLVQGAFRRVLPLFSLPHFATSLPYGERRVILDILYFLHKYRIAKHMQTS